MHVTLALILTAAAFWAVLPVKLVAIAGFAYVLIQTLKQIFPALSGWKAVALNIAVSMTGVLAVAQPGDFASPIFWSSLMLTIASAAGIHGTVKAATGNPSTPPAPAQVARIKMANQQASGNVGNKLLILAVLIGAIGVVGCQKTITAAAPPPLPIGAVDQADANAYKILRPAHDFAASISADIQSGKLVPSANLKLAEESLNRALNVADQAEQSYHAAGGGNAAAMNSSVAAVLQAWASAQSAINLTGK